MLIATYALNRVPLKFVVSTPYELWNNWKSDLSNLWSWGSVAYAHKPSHKYEKLGLKGRKCIFIRYNEHFKRYVFIGEHEDKIVIELKSWDVLLLEDNFPCMSEIDRDLHL